MQWPNSMAVMARTKRRFENLLIDGASVQARRKGGKHIVWCGFFKCSDENACEGCDAASSKIPERLSFAVFQHDVAVQSRIFRRRRILDRKTRRTIKG